MIAKSQDMIRETAERHGWSIVEDVPTAGYVEGGGFLKMQRDGRTVWVRFNIRGAVHTADGGTLHFVYDRDQDKRATVLGWLTK